MVCMDDQYKLTWKCVCVLQKVRPGICYNVSNMYVFTQRIFSQNQLSWRGSDYFSRLIIIVIA